MSEPTIFVNLEQGTDAWLAARCGLPTASVIGKLLTSTLKVADNDTSRGITETLVAERLSGHVDYVHPNADMQRGTMDEPYARAFYAEQFNVTVDEIGFATREFNGHLIGASPDGLIGLDGGLEIKSRRPKVHLRTIFNDAVPAENLAQIQTCMLVLNRDWWDYCSYSGGFPLFVKRVYADPKWQAAIVDAVDQLEDNAARMIADYNAVMGDKPVAPLIDHWEEIEIAL